MRDIYVFKDIPGYMAIHRGYLYYATQDYIFDGDDSESSSDSSNIVIGPDLLHRASVYRIPMDNMKKEPGAGI